MIRPGRAVALLTGIALGALSTPARAADTIETWDPGATNLEVYLGSEGLGLPERKDRATVAELVAGYGVSNRLSAFLGATALANDALTPRDGALRLGLFGTPVDTRHVDLDLLLVLEVGGPAFQRFAVMPGFELNLDLHPNRRSAGLYLRSGVQLTGATTSAPLAIGASPQGDLTFSFPITLGMYIRVAPRHEVLLESGFLLRPRPGPEERRLEVGGLALGYNVTLNDRVELVTQVQVDIPQGEETPAVSVMSGLIVTLPPVGR